MRTLLDYSFDMDENQLTPKDTFQYDMVDMGMHAKILDIETSHNCKSKEETLLYFPPQGQSEFLNLDMGRYTYPLELKVVEKDEKHAVLTGELEEGDEIRIILE